MGAGNAAQKANRTLPQIEKVLAGAAAADAAEDAKHGGTPQPVTPRTLARQQAGNLVMDLMVA